MEPQNKENLDYYRGRRRRPCDPERDKKFKLLFGLLVAAAGLLIMLKQLGLFYFSLHATWPFILIAVGLLIGVKNKFHKNAWWILILIGTAHLIPRFEVLGTSSSHLVWPFTLIILGLMIAFKPRKKKYYIDNVTGQIEGSQDVFNDKNELFVDLTFGARKEVVTSKEFKGGVISTTFGGYELNLMQADSIEQPMVLTLDVTFSGVEIIVPSHWEVILKVQNGWGSVEDRRTIRTTNQGEEKKTLILRGSVTMGSVEIKSY